MKRKKIVKKNISIVRYSTDLHSWHLSKLSFKFQRAFIISGRAVARSENLGGHVLFGGDNGPPGPPDCDRPANKSTVYLIIEIPYIHE